ncbi:MAG: ABC transporter ATP-binding protein [Oscillospiraceae bacterium]|nr:ABC transporter ATP-binding protein [Oscillospiraceae bacterium]
MGILTIDDLTHSFGKKKVLQGLSLDVPERSVFGFLGQNGAGKTTTMKAVLGLLKPSGGGAISVCGEAVRYGEVTANRHIGYLPDVPEFYGYMRPQEYMALCGAVSGMDANRVKSRTEELLALVGLAGTTNERIRGFSRGMRQRLGIAQALLNEPRLLICDEPTSALDPAGRKEMLDTMLAVRSQTTVLFSTHILADVERVCDRVAMLHGGKTVFSGTLNEIRSRRAADGYSVAFTNDGERDYFLNAVATQLPDVRVTVDGGAIVLNFTDGRAGGARLIALFARLNLVPSLFEECVPTLETMFMEVIG